MAGMNQQLKILIIGHLECASYLATKFDEPTYAACMLQYLVIDSNMTSLKELKAIAKEQGIEMRNIWKESVFRNQN